MNKFIYLIILVILIGGGFYLWQNRHDYFFQGEEPYDVYNEERPGDDEEYNDSEDENINENKNDQSENEDIENVDESGNQDLLDILQNHCGNRCEDKKDTSDYDYCLEICGFNTTDGNQSSDCGEVSGDFEKDVCYKKQAIRDKDSGVCDNISDDRLKENCKDRVIEELFN